MHVDRRLAHPGGRRARIDVQVPIWHYEDGQSCGREGDVQHASRNRCYHRRGWKGDTRQTLPQEDAKTAHFSVTLKLAAFRESYPQPPEWQRIGNQINTALVAARVNFVNGVASWSSCRAAGSGWLQR